MGSSRAFCDVSPGFPDDKSLPGHSPMFPVHFYCVQQPTSTDLDNSFTRGLRLQVSSVVGVLFPRRWSSLGFARSLKPYKKKIQSNNTGNCFGSHCPGNGIPWSLFSAPVGMGINESICVRSGMGMGRELLHARNGNGSRWVIFGTGISNNVEWEWEMMRSTRNGNGNKNGNGNGSHWVLFGMGMRKGIGRINAAWGQTPAVFF